MNEIEKDIMRGLVSILNEANDKYYNSGTTIMSDAQFDARLKDLKQLEDEVGFIFANSPTQNVGYKVLTELKEITHKYPMLSLDKVHSTEEIVEFSNSKELVASVKLDGCSVALTYEDGILIRGESRGDGYIGNDITEHVKRFLNVPLKINKDGTYLVYGEALIEDEDFVEVNKDNEFKNSRNLTSGTLTVLDTSLVSQRKLKFYVWDVIEGAGNSLFDNLKEAKELGFDVVPKWHIKQLDNNVKSETIEWIYDFAKDEGLPCDGVVFKFNDVEYGKSLGATSHHLKNGIAYKREDDAYETKLIDITYDVSKNGVLTPVAIFEPVEIDGSIVERASLANISIMEQTLDVPYSGQKVYVSKRNAVIPKVEYGEKINWEYSYVDMNVATLSDGRKIKLITPPHICPICGSKTEIKQDNNSKILVCLNDNCKGKLLGKLTHFASKNAMNIDGLSESTLEKFIELGYVNSFDDIYELKSRFYDELINLDGFGKKSIDKLMAAIETSKCTTLDRFIYSLCIPLIGKSASKTIAKYCDYDFDKFMDTFCDISFSDSYGYKDFDWDKLEGFGSSMKESMWDFWGKNGEECFIELPKYLTFVKPNKVDNNLNLDNKIFVITGSLNYFRNRDEVKEKIETAGGKVSNSVGTNTSYLINNNIKSISSKNARAKELGIPIISELELIEMLK